MAEQPHNAARYGGYVKYNEAVAQSYDRDRETERHWQDEVNFVQRYIAETKPATVLDLPVGTGRFLKLYASVARVTGVDVSTAMLGEAAVKARQMTGPSIVLERGDVFALHYADSSFDATIVVRLFHLIPMSMLKAAVHELCRVTSGEVVVQTYVLRPPAALPALPLRRRFRVAVAGAVRSLRRGRATVPSETKPWSHIESFSHDQGEIDGFFAACGFASRRAESLGDYLQSDIRFTIYTRIDRLPASTA